MILIDGFKKYLPRLYFHYYIKNFTNHTDTVLVFYFKKVKLYTNLSIYLNRYDKIIIYHALNLYHSKTYEEIFKYLIKSLKQNGCLIIKEPIKNKLEIYKIMNILESNKEILYNYDLNNYFINIKIYRKGDN